MNCLSNTYHRREQTTDGRTDERTNERHSHVDFLNLIVDYGGQARVFKMRMLYNIIYQTTELELEPSTLS